MLSDSDIEADEEEISSLNKSTTSNFTDDPPNLYSEATDAEKSLQDTTGKDNKIEVENRDEASYHHEDMIDPPNSDEETQESSLQITNASDPLMEYDISFHSQPINSNSIRENNDFDHLKPKTCPPINSTS